MTDLLGLDQQIGHLHLKGHSCPLKSPFPQAAERPQIGKISILRGNTRFVDPECHFDSLFREQVIKHPEKPDSIFLDALLKNGDGEWRA